MSLKSDAETVKDLSGRIVDFEILRAKLIATNGSILVIEDNPDSALTLTAGQKQALLALEDGWKATIKTIAAGW